MIISASRRTDLPAFYSDWFFHRIEAGFCKVQNPFNPRQVGTLSLRPEDVDAFVFWSKNPAPMLRRLGELERKGYRYYFQFTLNDYPVELEAGLPSLPKRVELFRELSRFIGKKRVIWRYDPIIISNHTGWEYHKERFSGLCGALAGHTERVMVSFLEFYRKTERNLAAVNGYNFDRSASSSPEAKELLDAMVKTASGGGIEILSCSQGYSSAFSGIAGGSCIDARLINDLWGCAIETGKDPGQREKCLCSVSRDVGANDTCIANCAYCYATRSNTLGLERHEEHDPLSVFLFEIKTKKGNLAAV